MARTVIRNVSVYVREALAAADPFYEGPRRSGTVRPRSSIVPLDPTKTAHDIGRLDDEIPHDGRAHLTGPVGSEGPEPTMDASHKREHL